MNRTNVGRQMVGDLGNFVGRDLGSQFMSKPQRLAEGDVVEEAEVELEEVTYTRADGSTVTYQYNPLTHEKPGMDGRMLKKGIDYDAVATEGGLGEFYETATAVEAPAAAAAGPARPQQQRRPIPINTETDAERDPLFKEPVGIDRGTTRGWKGRIAGDAAVSSLAGLIPFVGSGWREKGMEGMRKEAGDILAGSGIATRGVSDIADPDLTTPAGDLPYVEEYKDLESYGGFRPESRLTSTGLPAVEFVDPKDMEGLSKDEQAARWGDQVISYAPDPTGIKKLANRFLPAAGLGRDIWTSAGQADEYGKAWATDNKPEEFKDEFAEKAGQRQATNFKGEPLYQDKNGKWYNETGEDSRGLYNHDMNRTNPENPNYDRDLDIRLYGRDATGLGGKYIDAQGREQRAEGYSELFGDKKLFHNLPHIKAMRDDIRAREAAAKKTADGDGREAGDGKPDKDKPYPVGFGSPTVLGPQPLKTGIATDFLEQAKSEREKKAGLGTLSGERKYLNTEQLTQDELPANITIGGMRGLSNLRDDLGLSTTSAARSDKAAAAEEALAQAGLLKAKPVSTQEVNDFLNKIEAEDEAAPEGTRRGTQGVLDPSQRHEVGPLWPDEPVGPRRGSDPSQIHEVAAPPIRSDPRSQISPEAQAAIANVQNAAARKITPIARPPREGRLTTDKPDTGFPVGDRGVTYPASAYPDDPGFDTGLSEYDISGMLKQAKEDSVAEQLVLSGQGRVDPTLPGPLSLTREAQIAEEADQRDRPGPFTGWGDKKADAFSEIYGDASRELSSLGKTITGAVSPLQEIAKNYLRGIFSGGDDGGGGGGPSPTGFGGMDITDPYHVGGGRFEQYDPSLFEDDAGITTPSYPAFTPGNIDYLPQIYEGTDVGPADIPESAWDDISYAQAVAEADDYGYMMNRGGSVRFAQGGGLESVADQYLEPGSYVLSADVMSGLGDGSSEAGFERLSGLLGIPMPGTETSVNAYSGGPMLGKIEGPGTGTSDSVHTIIQSSDGKSGQQAARVAREEGVLTPESLKEMDRRFGTGKGDLGNAHNMMNNFMANVRNVKSGGSQPKDIIGQRQDPLKGLLSLFQEA